ncbi:MAG TPA: hypothetical protein VE130_06585 [Nitrososphaeraceae archaeon]|nr:hypothetical protein [Nitrososphaeraceae archaeon]
MSSEKAYAVFLKIGEEMAAKYSSVSFGKMMSSPALRYKSRVFAFYHNNEMIFRLGREFSPKIFNLKKCFVLNPFKNKAPMYSWFQVPFVENKKWKKLAEYALKKLMEES